LKKKHEGLEGNEPHQIVDHLDREVAPGPGIPLVVQHGLGSRVRKDLYPADVVVVPISRQAQSSGAEFRVNDRMRGKLIAMIGADGAGYLLEPWGFQ